MPAPAFAGEQLTTLPTTSWLTHGGNTWNQRHSSLNQINRDNVHELKARWCTRTGSAALAGCQ